MTKQEFIDRAVTMYELMNLCIDFDIDVGGTIVEASDLDEMICDDIVAETSYSSWDVIREHLNEIDDSAGWYVRRSSLEYNPIYETDFDEMLSDAIYFCELNGIFEDEGVEVQVQANNYFNGYNEREMSGVGYNDVVELPEDSEWMRDGQSSIMTLV